MAARELRYGYFRQLCQDIGAASVCVAHHRDDAVETLLMNLLRGSGIHGLTGIRPKNELIVRPLLCVSREEIEQYLHSIGQDYVTDSTNLVNDVLRNKIRLEVLPLLKTLNPKASENIEKTAQYLSEAEKIFDESIATQKAELIQCGLNGFPQTVAIPSLLNLPSPEYFLHEWLSPYGFNTQQTEQIYSQLNGESGREFLSSSHTLVIDRDTLILVPHQAPMKTMKMPEEGMYRYDENTRFEVKVSLDLTISKFSDCVTLDASTVRFPLTIRPVETGDRFCPFGMDGHRLISDFLTDCKRSILEKRSQLVVTDHDGQIIWVVGLRSDNRFRVTEKTSKILRLTLIKD
jgi:tRNA(Ile)-lysidine synthase